MSLRLLFLMLRTKSPQDLVPTNNSSSSSSSGLPLSTSGLLLLLQHLLQVSPFSSHLLDLLTLLLVQELLTFVSSLQRAGASVSGLHWTFPADPAAVWFFFVSRSPLSALPFLIFSPALLSATQLFSPDPLSSLHTWS